DIAELKTYAHGEFAKLTDVYGCVEFNVNKDDTTIRPSEYIRLSLETNAETVVKFMTQYWKLKQPDLIISVTGGAKNFDASTILRKMFPMHLADAAIRANAWLITAGINVGVVKEVGEALKYYCSYYGKHRFDVPCIGIGSWGYTAGNRQLDKPTPEGHSLEHEHDVPHRFFSSTRNRIRHDSITLERTDQYLVQSYDIHKNEPGQCYLEPNHTHFLLFDDGTTTHDAVIPVRAKIEQCSRNINLHNATQRSTESFIPIVMVLVDGGTSSIRTVCEALKHDTPVVVLKDSGRAADLIAKLHAWYSDHETDHNRVSSARSVDGEIHENIISRVHSRRPQSSASVRGSKKDNVTDILTAARSEIKDFRAVEDELCQILKQCKHLVTSLKLDLNEPHGDFENVFLEYLFNARRHSINSKEQRSPIGELKLAIAWHRFDYAQNYLSNERRSDYKRRENLRVLLVEALYHGGTDHVKFLIEFGAKLEVLTHGDLKRLYTKIGISNQLPIKDKDKLQDKDQYYLEYLGPIGDIIPRLLLGAYIYRHAATLTVDIDIQQQYNKHADQFDKSVASIIDLCYHDDDQFALDLLSKSPDVTPNCTTLELAQKARCQSFLASRCVQRYLDNSWYGYINYKRWDINLQIFIYSLLIPLTPILCARLDYVEKSESGTDEVDITQYRVMQNTPKLIPYRRKHVVTWWYKIKHFYQAPIVRFYYNVMKDLIFFICFILIFLFAFSIASWALITTNSQVYWHYSSDGSLSNVTVSKNDDLDAYSSTAFVLDIMFVTIANIILLSVLVALFNVTITRVEEQSKQVWGYHRFLLVNEYKSKVSLPPPFSILNYLFLSGQWLAKKLLRCSRYSLNDKKAEEFTDKIQDKRKIHSDYWWHKLRHEKTVQIEASLKEIEP
ncbi:unnamed protein product, partial [Rotaria sordida]